MLPSFMKKFSASTEQREKLGRRSSGDNGAEGSLDEELLDRIRTRKAVRKLCHAGSERGNEKHFWTTLSNHTFSP
jgi:hypothetical protein